MWLVFLVMGFLGSLTIAREDIVILYQGRVSGQHAVAIGYLLAGIASVGLYNCYRAMQAKMAHMRTVSRCFWLGYALFMALPFVFDRIVFLQPAEGILLVGSAVLVGVFGHIFYSKIKSLP
jgi:hypothetical protein